MLNSVKVIKIPMDLNNNFAKKIIYFVLSFSYFQTYFKHFK